MWIKKHLSIPRQRENDDLYVDSNQEQNTIYFEVFRRIFINSNHESHFNMMMGNIEIEVEGDAAADERQDRAL